MIESVIQNVLEAEKRANEIKAQADENAVKLVKALRVFDQFRFFVKYCLGRTQEIDLGIASGYCSQKGGLITSYRCIADCLFEGNVAYFRIALYAFFIVLEGDSLMRIFSLAGVFFVQRSVTCGM